LLDIDFAQVLIVFLVLLFSLTVHEAAHAWTADRLGDGTARLLGRVSLNPAVHVDPIGTIVFPLIALLTNVPVLGWAKPVPVSILNLHGNWQRKFMLIAAAGPASNLVLAAIAAVAFHAVRPAALLDDGSVVTPVAQFLFLAVRLNVLLAVFNMIPVPPLDGGNVLAGVLRGSASAMYDRVRPYGFMLLYLLMFSGILGTLIGPPSNLILSMLL
jgi:Zn-dependent protease